jgi:hypothetical protein
MPALTAVPRTVAVAQKAMARRRRSDGASAPALAAPSTAVLAAWILASLGVFAAAATFCFDDASANAADVFVSWFGSNTVETVREVAQ